jgi:hypothetical protein
MKAERKISQSFLKEFTKYLQNESCGYQVVAKYYDNMQFPSSEAQLLGQYFEYAATGQLPKFGDLPEPKMVSGGKKMSIPFARAFESAQFCKEIFKEYGIEIIETGLKLEGERTTGEIDVYAEWNGQKVFIDLKYSAAIDDKWSEFGWETESLAQKDNLMIQGVHYKMLAKECLDIEDIPFYYFIFSAKNTDYAKIIHQEVDEGRFVEHEIVVDNVYNKLKQVPITYFKPKPSLKMCSCCPIESCNARTKLPLIEKVYY